MMNLACKRKQIEDLQKQYEMEKTQMVKKSNPLFKRAKPANQVPKSTPEKRKPKPVLGSKKKKKKMTQKISLHSLKRHLKIINFKQETGKFLGIYFQLTPPSIFENCVGRGG